MANIPNKLRKEVYKRDSATDENGYKNEDYVICAACGKWHGIDTPSKAVHHVDSNRRNNQVWNLVTLCTKCHGTIHNVSIEKLEKQTISLSLYKYMLKLHPDRAGHYYVNFKINKIPEAQTEEITLENIREEEQKCQQQ